jgi:hypothetical protein
MSDLRTDRKALTQPGPRRRMVIGIIAATGALVIGAVAPGFGTSPRSEIVAISDGTSNT